MSIKDKLQQSEFNAIKDKPRVILRWATGVGKSKMAIDLLNYNANNYQNGTKMSVLFVVAERSHIQNWKDEFIKWGLSPNIKTTIICYASLHKMENEYFDAIVFDEAHHSFTEKRKEILKTMKANYIYLLSATLSYQKVDEISEIFGRFIISTVSLKKAINEEILPDPRVYIFDMELDNTVASEQIATGKGHNLPVIPWEDRAKYIYKNIPCIIKCTQKQKYDYLTQSMEYWKQRYERSHNDFHYNRWVSLGSLRKRFLGEAKTAYVRDLIYSFPADRRFICFCSSVAQANELDKRNTISSQRSSKLNQAIIDAFNKKMINRLYAVGMANEGLNLVDIQVGIIVQLDGKERLFVQRAGRILRANYPIVYIYHMKNTQDSVYLKAVLENIDEKFIEHINIK